MGIAISITLTNQIRNEKTFLSIALRSLNTLYYTQTYFIYKQRRQKEERKEGEFTSYYRKSYTSSAFKGERGHRLSVCPSDKQLIQTTFPLPLNHN